MHKGICAYVCLYLREKESESTYMCEILWTPQHQYVYMFTLEYNFLCTYSRVVHLNYNYHFFSQVRFFFSTFLELGRYASLREQWTGDLLLSQFHCAGITTTQILLNFTKCVLRYNSNLFALEEITLYVSLLPNPNYLLSTVLS